MDTEWAANEWAGKPRVIWEPIRPARSNLNYPMPAWLVI